MKNLKRLTHVTAKTAVKFILLPVLFSLPLLAQESTSKVLETKLALEASLERRVLSVLSEVTGTKDIIVMVNVELYDKQHEETQTEQQTSADVLPGIPVKDRPDITGTFKTSLTMVKTIQATVIVDKAIKTEQITLIRKVVGRLLGIPADRDDLLLVEKMDFKKGYAWTGIFKPPELWHLAWLLLGLAVFPIIFFVFLVPALKAWRELVTALKTRQPAQESGGHMAGELKAPETTETAASAVALAPSNGSEGSDNDEEKPHFWFLKESHLPVLLHIFKKLTPETLPVVIHYAPPELASKLLASMEESARRKITLALSKVSEITEDRLKLLEGKIRSQVDRVIGGEEKLLTIVERLPSETQQSIIKQLSEDNPETAEKILEQLISIADLGKINSPELQLALRRIPIKTIAPVLKSSETLAAQVLGKLPEEMAERFRHEINMARHLPKERLETEKRRIINVMKDMVREGWVVINRNGEHNGENKDEHKEMKPEQTV